MADMLVFAALSLSAFVPFILVTRLVEQGKNGAALTVLSVIGAVLAILMWGTNHDLGLDPIKAIAWALLLALPALMGGLAGALLGWLIRRRRDKRIK